MSPRRRKRLLFGALGLFIAAQLVPYGREHANPPITREVAWDSPRTAELFARACADCHSNVVRWPWYSWVAPASWLVQRDVRFGRHYLNVSEWDREQPYAWRAHEMLETDEMPPWFYLPLHPGAWLDDAERAELLAGLAATFGTRAPEPADAR